MILGLVNLSRARVGILGFVKFSILSSGDELEELDILDIFVNLVVVFIWDKNNLACLHSNFFTRDDF